MKLYYAPAACSLSPHIVLREAGLPFEMEQVNLGDKTMAGGGDYRSINPKGYVPALRLDDGTVLTEGPAIVQYIADQVPDSQLAPPAGTLERYQLIEWLNFISTEIHKNMGGLFKPQLPDATRSAIEETLAARLGFVAQRLGAASYLSGERFSVADAYLFVILNWAPFVKFDLSPWPALQAFHQRVAARPAVQAALRAEGLIKG